MKIQVNTRDLNTQLSKNIVCCSNNRNMPILSNVFCTIKGNDLTIKSSNLNIEVTTKINVFNQSNENFVFCFNPKKLLSLLQTIKAETITIDIKEKALDVYYEDNIATFAFDIANEFPNIISKNKVMDFKVDTNFFNEISTAKSFCANDGLRPVLESVLIDINNNELNIVATNAMTLYKQSYTSINNNSVQVLLNAECISILNRVVDINIVDTISIYEDSVVIDDGNSSCIIKTNNGKFPNWKVVVPDNLKNKIEVKKDDIIKSLKRLKIMTDNTNSVLKLQIERDKAILSFDNGLGGEKIKETISINYNYHDDLIIGLNIDFILQSLSSFTDDKCYISYSESNKAILITELSQPNKIVLIMPCTLLD